MATYTPFIERNVEKIAGVMRDREQRNLTSSAYMGDDQALGELAGINPQLAQQITAQRQQQKQQKVCIS